jgi:hypothetical protein
MEAIDDLDRLVQRILNKAPAPRPIPKPKGLQSRIERLAKRYEIPADELAAMMERQNYNCAICLVGDIEHIDHDHGTGRVRGLLCARCNSRLLPMIERYLTLIAPALKYLAA